MKQKNKQRNFKEELLTCPQCLTEFNRISNNQKFCSRTCKNLHFNPRKNISREDINKKLSKIRLKGFEEGTIKIWNKGLTKEDSESLRSTSKKNSEHMINQYKNGKKNWSEGLTKETSERVFIASQRSIDKRKEKGFEEMGKKLSATRKKMFNDGTLNVWNRDLTRDNNEIVNSIAEKISGDKCYNWKGGKSFEPYPALFTEHFKQTIRARDDFTCQICYIKHNKEIHKRRYPIHHIDGVKMNTTPKNSITLCKACHDLIHSGNNQVWIELIPNFQNKLHSLYGYDYNG
jgi:hypothetical protein